MSHFDFGHGTAMSNSINNQPAAMQQKSEEEMFAFLIEKFRDLIWIPLCKWDLAFQESGVRADIAGMEYWCIDCGSQQDAQTAFIERTVRCGKASIEPLFLAIACLGPLPVFFETLTQLSKKKGMPELIAARIDRWSKEKEQVPEPMVNLLIETGIHNEELATILELMLWEHPERYAEIAPKLGELTAPCSERIGRITSVCKLSLKPEERFCAAQVLIHVPLEEKDKYDRNEIKEIATSGKDEKVRAILLVNCPFLSETAKLALNGQDSSLHVRVAVARKTHDPKENAPTRYLPYILEAMVGACEDDTVDATNFIVTTLDFRAIAKLIAISCKEPSSAEVIGIAVSLLAAIFEKSEAVKQDRDYYTFTLDQHMIDLAQAFDRINPKYAPALAKLLANSDSPLPLVIAMKESIGGSMYLGTTFAILCRRNSTASSQLVEATTMPEEHIASAAMLALTLGDLAEADHCANEILARKSAPLRVRLAAVIQISKTAIEFTNVIEVLKEVLTNGDPLMKYIANSYVHKMFSGKTSNHQPALAEAAA